MSARHIAACFGKRVGNYLLEMPLGTGGEGSVFLARDLVLRRNVAVKVLRPPKVASPDASPDVQILEEARLIALLDHPNIVRVMHVELVEETWFVIMEMVDGGSLDVRVARLGVPVLTDALAYGAQVADALAHAHDIGIIHRDVKPGNLLVSKEAGWIKLADFGLAEPRSPNSFVKHSLVVGTPQYLAPEAWSGAPHSVASDIYSLGGCLHFMLTGQPPFQGTTVEVLRNQHQEKSPPLVKHVPPAVSGLISACLAKKPEDRPGSAAEVLDELSRLFDSVGGDDKRSALTGERRSPRSGVAQKGAGLMRWRAGDDAVIGLATLDEAAAYLEQAFAGGTLIRLYGPYSVVLAALSREVMRRLEHSTAYAGSVRLSHGAPRLLEAMAHALRVEEAARSPVGLVETLLRHHADARPVVEVDVDRPWTTADSGDAAALGKASDGRVVFVLLHSSTEALPGFENVEVPGLSPEEAQRYPSVWTAPVTQNRLRWSPDAIRLTKYFVSKGLPIDTVVLNSVAVALRAEMAIVTTWCVMEARTRGIPIRDLRELPSKRRQSAVWPDAETLSLLKSIGP